MEQIDIANEIKAGDVVRYTSYGDERTATVTHTSRSGEIVFLDNKRWMHSVSVTKL